MSIPYLFVGTRLYSSTRDGPVLSTSHRVVALIGFALYRGVECCIDEMVIECCINRMDSSKNNIEELNVVLMKC